jgi:flagellar basal-body rod protein FlgC
MTMDPLSLSSQTAFSGLFAQSQRMKVVAQNIANAESTGTAPGADAYRRKTVTFSEAFDQAGGVRTEIGTDDSAFARKFLPSHEAADGQGFIKMPNVNMTVEMTDMRQALRSYEANLQVIRQNREMSNGLLDLLRQGG